MIEEGVGDLLAAPVEALVNAVNTVGVMGKGLALAFKQRFPESYDVYRAACEAGAVKMGAMHLCDRAPRSPRWIIAFPTKRHWRDQSRLDDIRAGLVDLIAQIEQREIRSVAVPALGCGLGGLAWQDVRPLIEEACARLPEVKFVVFAPR